jgi:hypothetical protein
VINQVIKNLKKRFSIPRTLLWLIFIAFVLLAGAWYSLPSLAEWGIERIAKDAGSPNFKMEVPKLDLWQTKIVDLSGDMNGNSLAIDQIDILYDPSKLALGEINALSVTGLSAKVNIDEKNAGEEFDQKKLWSEILDLADLLLIDPPISYLRIRDSTFSLFDQNISREFLFGVATEFLENLTHLTWDAKYSQAYVMGEVNLSREGNATFMSMKTDLNDAGILFDEFSSDPRFIDKIPKELRVSSGSLAIDTFARLVPTGLEDLFLELNGSNFQLGWDDYNFSIPKLMLFFSPENEHNWTLNSYANFRQDNNLIADEINLSVVQEEKKIDLRGGVSYLKTQNLLPPLELIGLRFPHLEFDLDEFNKIPYGEEKKIAFDELTYGDQFFRLYNGLLSFLFVQDRNVNLRMFPIDGSFLDLGVSLVQFSYYGRVDLDQLPRIETPQIVLGERVISGDDILLENLALTFRIQDISHFIVNMLSFTMSGNEFEFSPANIVVGIPQGDVPNLSIKFDKSNISILNQDLSVTGLEGEIQFNSLDPLETNGTQIVRFERVQISGIELKDGNFSFEILPDGTFLISEGNARLYDGIIGLLESSFNLYGEQMTIKTIIKEIDGQKIADLIDGLEVEVNGSFSGRIPFTKQEGKWDFEDGYLQLDPSTNARLKCKSNGFLTNGIKEGTEEYKRMKMTELALENLKLDSLVISFEVDGDERQILGDIRGRSLIRKKTEVSLDYRPKIIAGLSEIIHKLNFNKLGL